MQPPDFPIDEDIEIVPFPCAPDKPPRRLCVPRGQDVINSELLHLSRRDYAFQENLYRLQGTKGGAYLEVGGNIGSDTIRASDFFETCYVFEPASRNIVLLRKNIELNQIPNVQIFPFAVSNYAGICDFYLAWQGNAGTGSLKQNHPSMNRTEKVKVVTLDTIMQSNVANVSYVHIDAEGHDIKVLQGAGRFISRQARRPVIRMEFSPRALKTHGSNADELFNFMNDHSYKIGMNVQGNMVPSTPAILQELFNRWRESFASIDIFLLP